MIVIENIQSVGPWGVSRGLESSLKKQLFTDNLLELPWQYSRKSLEDQILSDQLDGRINNDLLDENLLNDGRIKNLPRDTKFAIQLMKNLSRMTQSEKQKSGLVCALSGAEQPNDEEILRERNPPQKFRPQNTQPYSLINDLPNQFMANLAIHFGLHGDSINFCGPNSSFNAIESAIRNISSGLNDEIFFAGSFCYEPSIIPLEFSTITQSASDFFKLNQVSFNEWIGVTRLKKSKKIKPEETIISALISSRLDIDADLEKQVFGCIQKLAHQSGKTTSEIDLILINDPFNSWLIEQITILNFFQPHIKIIDFYERLGNSLHCNFVQCLELAQMIFANNQIPYKVRSDFRQNTNSFQMAVANNNFSGQCCLIICSNSMGDLHMGLIERYSHEM